MASLSRTGSHPRGEGWVQFLKKAIKDVKRVDGRTRRQRLNRVDPALVRTGRFDINRGY